MCQVEGVAAIPRKVKDFERGNVFQGGQLVKIAGEYWIELGKPIPVPEVAKATTTPAT